HPGARQPLLVRDLLAHNIIGLSLPVLQPTRPQLPILNISHSLTTSPWPSIQVHTLLIGSIPFPADGQDTLSSPSEIIYQWLPLPITPSHISSHPHPATSTCRTWRLPLEMNVVTVELYAIQQAPLHHTFHCRGKAVVYTDSLSSLHLLLSQHPTMLMTLLYCIQQALLHLAAHSGVCSDEVADATAKMALSAINIIPLPFPLATVKHLISHICHLAWDYTLDDVLHITSMGQYWTDSFRQPWIWQWSCILNVTIAHLHLGHTTLTDHLHCPCLSPDPFCP
ncbi:uncharacterized protein LOC135114389, partial [Scylla paramamosain]|uniref:uncharacterized protein LOC135114389 n=1 Tax=Scylla paramamosain TaxID=85552 RepID=UPI003083A70F